MAHIKDRFLPLSETFIYPQVSRLDRYRSVVLDRHRRQNRTEFPWSDYYSVVERRGSWYAMGERLALRYFGYSPYLERILRVEKVQVIHAHFGQLGALITPVARRLQIPLVVSFYGKDLSNFVAHPRWKGRFADMWQTAQAVLALGEQMVEALARAGCPRRKLSVMPIAVDLGRIQYVERQPPVGPSPLQMVGVGRLIKKKGFDVALRALSHLPEPEKVHFTIVGDGPQRDELQALVAQLDLAQTVSFAGWLSHERVIQEMSRAHVFLLPSRTDPDSGEMEGTPTVLLEAQATGLPVISTVHAGIPDIVQNGRTGWLVAEDNEHALSAQLQDVLDKTQELPAFSRRARTFVERYHSADAVMDRLQSVYDMCVRPA